MRIKLNGEVVSDGELWLYDWFEIPAFSPQRVRDAIEATPEGEDLVLEINSGGGSAFAGFEIYSVLRSSERRTVAEIQSIAASAASVLMLGADEVVASPVAQVMIHLPWMQTVGDRRDHLDSVEMLDSVTDSILNAYTVKCGGKTDRGQLKSLMRASSWLTAPEAKELGLVDRISGEDRIDPAAVLNSCGGGCGIRSLAGRPAPSYEDLLSRYREQVQAGIAPERREALNAVTSLEMPLPALTTNCAISSASTDGLPVQWVTGTSATISTQSLSPWSFPITGSAARDFAAEAQQEGEDAAEAQQEAEAELQEAKARLELEKIRFGG